jgi:hypothetical protein
VFNRLIGVELSTSPRETEEAFRPLQAENSKDAERCKIYYLSQKQQQHATLILKEVPELQELRRKVCPAYITEDRFWRIYFLLVGNKLGHILDDNDEEEELASLTEHGKKKKEKNSFFSCSICLMMLITLLFFFLFLLFIYFITQVSGEIPLNAFAVLYSGQEFVKMDGVPTLPISSFYP